jgi:hypothetical protein
LEVEDMKKKFVVAILVAFLAVPTLVNAALWFDETLNNDTDFAWTGYRIDVGMADAFTISHTNVITPAGWTFIVTDPMAGLIPSGGSGYVGTIDYYIGTGSPIAIGADAEFGFEIPSFTGIGTYSTEQTPIPEPATITLLCIGALALTKRK